MSRSYRKHPYSKDPDAGYKKLFNRCLRRSQIDNELLPQYGAYRKMNESWDIHDYKWSTAFEDYRDFYINYYDMTEEEAWAEWKRKYWSK